MNNKFISWILFILLCIIWGSSFILMKWGMYDSHQNHVLSPYQVASLRMLSAGLVMLPFAWKAIKVVPRPLIKFALLSGWFGSFFAAFLFCIAETKIDSALAGCLNALTPLFVVITGFLFFNVKTTTQKVIGVIIGLSGCCLLTYSNSNKDLGNIAYAGLLIIATALYGINVNMIHKKLVGVRSIQIAAIAFTGLIPFSLLVLVLTGYFNLPFTHQPYLISSLASCTLGIFGTTIASILFYVLVKKGGGLFASMVTYGIPFVAIAWGVYYNEHITTIEVIALMIILSGVYLANKKTSGKATN